MKTFIQQISFRMLLVTIMSFSMLSLKAGDIKVKTGEAKLKVGENSYTKLQLSNTFTTINYRTIKTDKGNFTDVEIPEYGSSNAVGLPKLPMLRKLIEVPLDATVEVKIVSYSVTEYKLSDFGISNKLMPAQPPVSKNEKNKIPDFEQNDAAYNADQFNNDELVSVEILGQMRGVRLARLNIAPVRYNPVTNTIQVYNDIKVEVTFPGGNITQTIEEKRKTYSHYFESMFGNQLVNYKSSHTAKDTMSKYPVKYVIVSDPAFQAALQPFVQWKTKKGFTVVEAYTNNVAVGNTTTSIKNYLEGLYNAGTASDPAPSFVLLVGDVAQIPTFAGTTGTQPTDLYYCEYTGDYFPEVYYGRFSADSLSQLQPQINKTLEYEQYLMPDPSYLTNCVMIAGQDATNGPLYGDGQINYGTSTYFNSAHGLNSFTYLFAISGSSASNIIQNVSNGVCYANYTAHGSPDGWYDPAFSISDIAGLQNAHKYPLMVGNCCQTNTFNVDCFGAELLRANNKGAVGYIGGSNSTYWDEDFWWGVGYKTVTVNPTYNPGTLGAYDRTFHDHGETFGEWYASQGQMVFAGDLAVTQSGSSMTDYYWEIYCLMGDPSLMIYYGVPPALTATYNPLITLGATTFTVTTEPYAYAAVSTGGVLHGAALADSLGVANITIAPFTVAGTADVVVTKQNRAPFINTVLTDNPTGPYIIYNNNVIHDTGGNNNGLADDGENITLDITLQNVGLSTAHIVSAKLRTNDTYVTLNDTTQLWGTITNGLTSMQSNAYSITVSNSVPDHHLVSFSLYITDSLGNSWTGTFNIVLNAPSLSIGTVTVDDAIGGNGNGHLDPGETANIIIHSSNTGHADAANSVSDLSLISGPLTVNNGTANLGTLAANTGSANASFSVTVSPSAIIGSYAAFTNKLTSGLYSAQKPISLMIGVVDEDWETGNFNKFLWVQGQHPWTITTVNPFQGIYSARSGVISDTMKSTLSISFYVSLNDSISFYKRVSSEEGYDYLRFYIDGTQMGEWSGTESDSTGAWSRAAFPVTQGAHTFQWSYEKDVSISEGSDCGWIDYILFPPISPTAVNEITSDNNQLSCYPNPFSHSTTIGYTIEKVGKVTIKVFNFIGQEVATLVNGENTETGNHTTTFNAGNLRSGIYHCVLTTDNKTIVKEMVIAE